MIDFVNDDGYNGSGRMSKEAREELNKLRLNTAIEMAGEEKKDISDVSKIISEALKGKGIEHSLYTIYTIKGKRIEHSLYTIDPSKRGNSGNNVSQKQEDKPSEDWGLENWQGYIDENKKYIIFVAFTKSGHVACVGAGGDLKFPEINEKVLSESAMTPKLLYFLKVRSIIINKDCGVDSLWEWDKDRFVVIELAEVDESDNVLHWRDGVECYIGEVLLEKNVPILNAYSHRNWKMEKWNAWRDNGENGYIWYKC